MQFPSAAPAPSVAAVLAAATIVPLAVPGGPAVAQDRSPAPAPGDSSAVLHGRVFIAGTGESLQGAVIGIDGRDRSALSDDGGRYALTGLAPGEVTVRASYLGARTRGRTVTLSAGEARRVDFPAEEAAVELSELRVEVQRRRRGKMAGFEERREEGWGEYVTRAEIERIRPLRTTQMLRGLPGVRVDFAGGEYVVRFRGGGLRGPTSLAPGSGTSGQTSSGCEPTIYLDGAPIPSFRANDVPPSDIEAIEVYEGPAVPARFRSLGGCGSLVIWTRSGS